MRKRNHYELTAAAYRASMRNFALSWRANITDPLTSSIMPEQHADSIATNLSCAKSYRDMARDYDRMGAQEREETERKPFPPTLPDGPDLPIIKDGEPITCPRCHQAIDPDVCYCGDPIKGGSHDCHTPTPMGCRCGYPKETPDEVAF